MNTQLLQGLDVHTKKFDLQNSESDPNFRGTGQLRRVIRGISKGKVQRSLLATGKHVRFDNSTRRRMLLGSERLGLYAASAPDRLAQALANLLTDVGADQRFREGPKLLADWMLV